MPERFKDELDRLIQKYLDAGMDQEEIISDLELKKMALEEDQDG